MIESPILIAGCARSGTTLLYNVLSEVNSLWSIGVESKVIIERYHHPSANGWESGELSAADLTAESRDYILGAFESGAAPGDFWRRVNGFRARLNQSRLYNSIKRRGRTNSIGSGTSSGLPGGGLGVVRAYVRARNALTVGTSSARKPIRLLDKSPEHCLRLPFMTSLFPDAKVIFITRDGRANVHSLLEGWRHPHLFPGYETPVPVTSPGQTRGRWAFTLIPGWRDLVDRPLEEICARQWVAGNAAVLEYIGTPNARPALTVRYEDLVADPGATLGRIAAFLGFASEEIPAYGRSLPEVNVVSRPGSEKWRREANTIAAVAPILEPMMDRLGYEPD